MPGDNSVASHNLATKMSWPRSFRIVSWPISSLSIMGRPEISTSGLGEWLSPSSGMAELGLCWHVSFGNSSKTFVMGTGEQMKPAILLWLFDLLQYIANGPKVVSLQKRKTESCRATQGQKTCFQ